jgi:hypothetical protein
LRRSLRTVRAEVRRSDDRVVTTVCGRYRARVLWPGLSGVAKDGGAEPLAGKEGQFDSQLVVGDGMAEGLLGLADPILNTVLVQDEPLGGGLETAVLQQKHPQGVTQPGMLVIVIGQLPERLVHPGPQQLDRARHQGQRRHLAEAGRARPRRTLEPYLRRKPALAMRQPSRRLPVAFAGLALAI